MGATAWVPGEHVTWEGWEDSAVPPDKVGPYLRELCELYDKHGYEGALYGHFGQGCIHTRITFDLLTAEGIANYRSFMDDATSLVVKYRRVAFGRARRRAIEGGVPAEDVRRGNLRGLSRIQERSGTRKER